MFAATFGAGVPAVAAPPTIERIQVDDTFVDRFLSAECGVRVTTTARGRVTIRSFDRGRGPVELVTINIALTATADGRTFRFRDVGSDLTRITPDGTAVLKISGQVPFQFAGVLKINLTTGEAILEPKDRSGRQLARACAALGG
jgi:hypothetical protein